MASAPKTYPYQDVTTTYKTDPFFKEIIWGSKNAPGRLLVQDASRRGRIYAGAQQGDPASLEKYFGYKPTNADYATLGATPGANPGPGSKYMTQFDPVAHQYRNVANPQYNSSDTSDTQKAANGGLMSLRKFATGKTTKQKLPQPDTGVPPQLSKSQEKNLATLQQKVSVGKKLTQAEIAQYNRLNTKQTTYTDFATKNPDKVPINTAPYTLDQAAGPDMAFWDPGTNSSTNPYVNTALDTLSQWKMPEEYGQANDVFNTAGQGLLANSNYQAQQINPMMLQNYQGTAAQMGPVANISAQQAAAQQAAAAQMGPIADIAAERAAAAKMGAIKDVNAPGMQYFQMDPQDISRISTKDLEAFQMAGPGSWTDEGVSQKYMNPYIQGVIDISKREKGRDYAKLVNQLNANSISAGAFGGARQALETSNAARDYQQQLQDLEAQGLNQAYMQGMNQWTGETQMAQQAAIQNLAAKMGAQSQSSQQSLQAALANQGIDYQAAVANLQAKLGVQAQEADQILRAALANQQTQFGVGSLNAQNEQSANLANMQAALQAAMANQQTQFGVGSLNAQNAQSANNLNAQLGTQASLANAQNALQAAMANQQTQYNTGAFNAGNQQNMNLANLNALIDIGKANQTTGFNAAQSNQLANLQAQQQNTNAMMGANQSAQGIASLGDSRNNAWNTNWGNQAAAGQYVQGLGQQANDALYNKANAFYNGVPNATGAAINAAQTNPQGGSQNVTSRAPAPAI